MEHPHIRNDAAGDVTGIDDPEALDAPLRRELDELFRDPEVELHIQGALDAAYAMGVRPLP